MFLKMTLESLFSRAYMLFDTGNPNLRSIFKAEVVIMVLLRMRNNKVDTVNPNLKCILKPDKVCFRADAKVFFLDQDAERQVSFETGCSYAYVSAHRANINLNKKVVDNIACAVYVILLQASNFLSCRPSHSAYCSIKPQILT